MMKTRLWNSTALGALLAVLAPQYAQAETPATQAGNSPSSNTTTDTGDGGSAIIVTAMRGDNYDGRLSGNYDGR